MKANQSSMKALPEMNETSFKTSFWIIATKIYAESEG